MSTIKFLNLITLRKTYGVGDFRSPECIELLKEADIVVTNPPFSLLREFIAQLVEYNKKFLIIGNSNAIGNKEVFPLFKDNKIWLGISIRSGTREFYIPFDYDVSTSTGNRVDSENNRIIKIGGVRWFTNLKITKRNKPLMLEGSYYTPEKYPKYDNYDAINVDKVADIPCDYPGVMGVPISFMDKYCPEQFSILGLTSGRKEFSREAWPTVRYVNPIRHNIDGSLKNGSEANTSASVFTEDISNIYYTADNVSYKFKRVYIRILIKNKHPQKSKEREKVNKIFTLPKSFLADCALVLEKKVA